MILACASGRTIRRAMSTDASVLAYLGEKTYAQTFAKEYPPGKLELFLSENFAVEKIRDDLNNAHVVFYVAEENDTPIGYAKLVQNSVPSDISLPDPIELERLYVLCNWHGSGLANSLLDVCITEAHQLKCKTLWLAVWEHNNRAKAFYSRERFRLIDVTKKCDGIKLQVMVQEL